MCGTTQTSALLCASAVGAAVALAELAEVQCAAGWSSRELLHPAATPSATRAAAVTRSVRFHITRRVLPRLGAPKPSLCIRRLYLYPLWVYAGGQEGYERGTNTTTSVSANTADRREVTIAVAGMTCASCAARVEKNLNRIAGVSASVNFATEQAKVKFADNVRPEDLVAAVEATGYTATLPAESLDEDSHPPEPDAAASWRQLLAISGGPGVA